MSRQLVATDMKNMDGTVKDLVNKLRGQIEKQLGRSFTTFIPLLYKQESSVGITYWVKILAENEYQRKKVNECVHVKISLASADSEPELKDKTAEKSVLDEIITA